MRILTTILLVSVSFSVTAQEESLPYYEIPAQPDRFTAGTVASRLLDGVGFRYYWSTEGLRREDLDYRPGADARTTKETLVHIYELSLMIVNSTTNTPNTVTEPKMEYDFTDLRRKTLKNIQAASARLRKATDKELESFKIIFPINQETLEFPFWNNLNGPIADALWHIGQVVSFRRSSGNPLNSKVDVFSGKLMN